jgi:hypothetical protein
MRYLLISFNRKENGQIDELVSVGKRIRTSDMNSQNLILDFAEKKVVKCVIEGHEHPTTFDLMRQYYHKVYPNLIEQLEKEAKITAEVERQKDGLGKVTKKKGK